jgi:hypothetical protein
MTIESHGHEHEFEPQYGLPERLPAGEHILWQGSPDFVTLARRVFHIRTLALYFALLMATMVVPALWEGAALLESLASLKWLAPLAVVGLGSVTLLAWLTARTTVYTLTDKRIVMRVGIVLTVTFNLPLRTLAAAGLRRYAGGFGDITLALAGSDRIAWLQLWPSVRPWRFNQPEPMLRGVASAEAVAQQITHAWTAATGGMAQAVVPAAAAPGTAAAAEAGSQATPHSAPQWRASPT